MLLPLLQNLDMFTAPTVTPDEPQKPGAGGGGRKPWWSGEWITPGVDAYLPEPPPEDITPLRPQVADLKARVQAVGRADPEYARMMGAIGALHRQVKALELQAAKAVEEALIRAATEAYRKVAGRVRTLETVAAEMERREARRQRIIEDDNQIIQLIAEILP